MTPMQQILLGTGAGKTYYSNDFDGSSELIIPCANGNLNYNASGNITIEFWAYLDTLNNNNKSYQTLVGRWDGTNGYCWSLDTNKNDGDLNLYIGNGTNYVQSEHAPDGTLSAGQWYHIAVVKNGASSPNSKIYVDGTAVHSFGWNVANSNNSTAVAVGNNYPDASNYGSSLDGRISNFRFMHGAVYTSNFTPPTEPFEGNYGGNAMFILCRDDSPTTAHLNTLGVGGNPTTITQNGGVTSSTDNPF